MVELQDPPEVGHHRENTSSPLDSLLMERKVSHQIRPPENGQEESSPEVDADRSDSPLDTVLLERRVAFQQRRLARGREAGSQFRPVLPSRAPASIIMPHLRQTVRSRLQQVIDLQVQQVDEAISVLVDRTAATSPELVFPPHPISLTSPSTSSSSLATPSPTTGMDRLSTSSPVDSLLLERKVLRQQRKRFELDEHSKEDVGNATDLWMATGGVAFGVDERGSPLSPKSQSTPWASPRKQQRASPGA